MDGPLHSGVILCDVHYEERDKPAWGAVLAYLADQPPDEIVIAGDFLELASCSSHPGATTESDLREDLTRGREGIAEMRRAAPLASIVYMEGNHETRLLRWLRSNAPALLGSLSVEAGLDLARLGILYVPEDKQPIERGNLRILHGHQAMGKFPPRYHAARVAELYGRHGTVTVYGHTHKPQSIQRVGDEVARGVGLGCLRMLHPGWLHGSPAGWEHGFGIFYARPDGVTDLYSVAIREGRFAWAGKVYGA